jgi:hypothetical protein
LCLLAPVLSEAGHMAETELVTAIARALRNGARFPELIAAEDAPGGLILIEGHLRDCLHTSGARR